LFCVFDLFLHNTVKTILFIQSLKLNQNEGIVSANIWILFFIYFFIFPEFVFVSTLQGQMKFRTQVLKMYYSKRFQRVTAPVPDEADVMMKSMAALLGVLPIVKFAPPVVKVGNSMMS